MTNAEKLKPDAWICEKKHPAKKREVWELGTVPVGPLVVEGLSHPHPGTPCWRSLNLTHLWVPSVTRDRMPQETMVDESLSPPLFPRLTFPPSPILASASCRTEANAEGACLPIERTFSVKDQTVEILGFVGLKGFFFRKWKGGRKREKKTSLCGCVSHTPHKGPGLQPRHVPRMGIELVTLWFAVQRSIH